MSSFCSPIMQVEEVVNSINSFNEENKIMTISANDITQPKPFSIQQIYALIFQELTGKTVDNLSQSSLQAMQHFDYPEIHEGSLRLKYLGLCMSQLMHDIGIEGFSVMDLINPKPKKTLRLLSGLLNFHIFAQERLGFVEQLNEERKHIQESEKLLMNENEEIHHKINIIKARKLEHEPECKQLDEEVAVLSSNISEQQKLNGAAQQKLYEKDKEISGITAQLEHLNNSSKRLHDSCKKLSALIVSSPERMKNEEEHKKIQVKDLKERRTRLIQQEEEAVNTTKKKRQWINDFEPILALLERLKDLYDEELSMKGKLERCIDQLESQKYKNKDGVATGEQLKQALDGLNDKVNKFHFQYTRKIECLEAMKQKAVKSLEDLEAKKDQEHLVIVEKKKNVIKLEEEIDNKLCGHQDSIQQMQSKYDNLLVQIDSYHCKLAQLWENC